MCVLSDGFEIDVWVNCSSVLFFKPALRNAYHFGLPPESYPRVMTGNVFAFRTRPYALQGHIKQIQYLAIRLG